MEFLVLHHIKQLASSPMALVTHLALPMFALTALILSAGHPTHEPFSSLMSLKSSNGKPPWFI
jgi:hypothetical protein